MNGFSLYYIMANLLCVVIFTIMLVRNFLNIDRQEKQIKFDRALIVFILYFFTDCFWAAIVDGIIPKNIFGAVNFLIYFFMAATTYTWLDFVMAYEQVPGRDVPRCRFLLALPIVVSSVGMIFNFIIAPEALVNYETLEALPGFTFYLVTAPTIYQIAVLFYTLRRARHEENPAEKRKHLYIGFLPLSTTIGGLLQEMLFPFVPIYCGIVLILMFVFYVQSLEYRISLDPLTGLNNRGQLERYCGQRGNLYLENRKTAVVMMDIDKFKSINDTYGHAEGDRALVIVAEALKKAVSRCGMPSFLCRYGGDEFTLIAHPVKMGEVDNLIQKIRDEIEGHTGRGEMSHPISISAGYDELRGKQDTIKDCMHRADEKLYLDKGKK